MQISARAQRIMLWWCLVTLYIYGFSLWLLLGFVPPPAATLSAAEVAAFYTNNNLNIRVGSMITSWTSAFMVPLAVVFAVQMARLEKGVPIWSILQFAGGIMMSLFLVLPPLFWGIAAFSPERPAEVTALMHEIGTLTLVTTDQFYIFQMVAITYVSLTQKVDSNSPFPRWFGYFTAWAALMFEVGAIAFIPKTGPFSWNGVLVFWCPLIIFGGWITVSAVMLFKGIKRQEAAAQR